MVVMDFQVDQRSCIVTRGSEIEGLKQQQSGVNDFEISLSHDLDYCEY